MAGVFINAHTAREQTRNTAEIHAEISDIEKQVFANVDAGVPSATITGNTNMTNNNAYYDAYFGVTNDPVKSQQISFVVKYFQDLGYGITVGENPQTGNTITWTITW